MKTDEASCAIPFDGIWMRNNKLGCNFTDINNNNGNGLSHHYKEEAKLWQVSQAEFSEFFVRLLGRGPG